MGSISRLWHTDYLIFAETIKAIPIINHRDGTWNICVYFVIIHANYLLCHRVFQMLRSMEWRKLSSTFTTNRIGEERLRDFTIGDRLCYSWRGLTFNILHYLSRAEIPKSNQIQKLLQSPIVFFSVLFVLKFKVIYFSALLDQFESELFIVIC